MRLRIILGVILLVTVLFAVAPDVRVYRQTKDVSTRENGDIAQSTNKADLFECTYVVDEAKGIIVRTKIRRLDDEVGREDHAVYEIRRKRAIVKSHVGDGGETIVAVRHDGGELLELGQDFAFTSRVSPFSQVVSGVYKRI